MSILKVMARSRHLISLLLLFSAFCCISLASYADAPVIPETMSVAKATVIQGTVERYFEQYDLNPDMISIGYINTGNNESWFFNGDLWYYSASLYKVPLMMIYAEKEAAGELTQDSEFFGLPLSYLEEEILTFSNNDLAYSMMLNLTDPFACRKLFCSYSDLPEDYYSWEFTGYSYFTARFMTSVMYTLYSDQQRFPGILECLKKAQPEHYFRMSLEDENVEIAQKYGNFHDEDGNDWNHTAGIIFTDNPFLLTVMTRYGGLSETIIADLAQIFYDYTVMTDSVQNELPADDKNNDSANAGSNERSESTVNGGAAIRKNTEEGGTIQKETSPAQQQQAAESIKLANQGSGFFGGGERLTIILCCSAAVLLLLLVLLLGKRHRTNRNR